MSKQYQYGNVETLRFRVFTRTTSKVHLEAGATWQLALSAASMQQAFEMIEDHINTTLNSIKIEDAEALS